MIGIQRLREIFPQYADKSDEQLANAYYKKLYSKMPYEEFQRRFMAASVDYAKKNKGRSNKRESAAAAKAEAKNEELEFIKEMARAGYGRDKDSGAFFPLLVNEDGKSGLDYLAGAASEEFEQEIKNKIKNRNVAPEIQNQDEFDAGWYKMKEDNPEWRNNFKTLQAKSIVHDYENQGGNYDLPDGYSPVAEQMQGMDPAGWENALAGARKNKIDVSSILYGQKNPQSNMAADPQDRLGLKEYLKNSGVRDAYIK